ncbi:rare lipoprotein A [Rivularia sp. PCC 7116]|uniref:septal ring lytic transglycosylase RlpA family protein n=1 Tax=Rivularia sp. PCC 7116 TaxID=373994 RepID=UPI00029EF39C|nr:septal ring lytic transglycosylase RlpA family protein [Rivularia sp. PCC 7116]AFY55217.1 rare lipoprotein A [Rivularia sp. PCC 7116]
MNQRLLWTVVAVISTVAGTPSISRAQAINEASITSQKTSEKNIVDAAVNESNYVITKIHAHKLGDREAATLYIRNIPAFTFLNSVSENSQNKANLAVESDYSNPVEKANAVAAKINDLVNNKVDANKITVSWNGTTGSKSESKTLIERYIIKVDDSELVEINSDTILPDATKNLRQDALQATNRLRRLVGKASPLKTIAGLPPELTKPEKQAVKIKKTSSNKHHTKKWRKAARGGRRFRGIASFYGAYFAGRKTASGERFNPSRMTAAHKTLPFGTRVRVTNMRNGRSVVVRINDRGPFIRGRVIDLSRGAAGVIGMIGRGIAPVRVEVLGR